MDFAERRVPARLIEIASGDDTIWFVGSGVSIAAGLPSWSALLSQLVEHLADLGRQHHLVEKELANREYLRAASYGFDALTSPEQAVFLRQALKVDTAQPSELHRALADAGARNIVTTNFDTLVERSMPNRPRVVLASQLVELAEIMQARSRDFVLKMHGDISDIASIVFTREQYRDMLDGRRNVAEALKTLLVSRPVIYIGFGLRDPDFVQAMDALALNFRVPVRDHFALMCDISDAEIDYWRRSTGIELVPYRTSANGSDHSELLATIREMAGSAQGSAETDEQADATAELRAGRFLSRVVALYSPSTERAAFSVRYTLQTGRPEGWLYRDRLVDLVDIADGNVLLTGPPGSGKTTAVSALANAIATRSLEDLLGAPHASRPITLPLIAAARNYSGDLRAQLENLLPPGLSLDRAYRQFRLMIVLDGLNEAPLDYLEQVKVEVGMLIAAMPLAVFVLVDRHAESWTKLDVQEISVGALGPAELTTALTALGLDPDTFDPPALEVLSRPLFLRMISTGGILAPEPRSAPGIFHALLASWQDTVQAAITSEVDLSGALSDVAFGLLVRGVQLMDVSEVVRELKSRTSYPADADVVLNLLLEMGVLVAEPGQRVAFFHQSVTEFFAASRVAEEFVSDPNIVELYLRQSVWDQTFLHALGHLDVEHSGRLFDRLLAVDLSLAFRGLWFLRHDQRGWTAKALDRLLLSPEGVGSAFELSFPEYQEFESQLRRLFEHGGLIGGQAATMLLKTAPKADQVDRLFDLLRKDSGGGLVGSYHWRGMSMPVRGLFDEAQARELLARLPGEWSSIADGINDEIIELWGPIEVIAALIGPHVEKLGLLESGNLPEAIVRTILVRTAYESPSVDGLIFLVDDALRSHDSAYWLRVILERPGLADLLSNPSLVVRLERLADRLLEQLMSGGSDVDDPLRLLLAISKINDSIRAKIAGRADSTKGVARAALLHLAGQTDDALRELAEVASGSELKRRHLDEWWEAFVDVDWASHSESLVDLVRKTETFAVRIVDAALGTGAAPAKWIADLSEHDVERVLHLMTYHGDRWHRTSLGRFIAEHGTAATQRAILKAFSEGDKDRKWLMNAHVLPYVPGLTTSDISVDDLMWMLGRLGRDRVDSFAAPPIARIADEHFVRERILPAWRSASGVPRDLIAAVVAHCERILGLRFLANGVELTNGQSSRLP